MITTTYHSPLGDIALAADARGLRGLWFCDLPPRDVALTEGCVPFDMHLGAFVEPDGPFGLVHAGEPVGSLESSDPSVSSGPVETIEGCDAVSGCNPMSASDPRNAAAVSVLERAWAWLNAYFAGRPPRWIPPLRVEGSDLDHAVLVALLEVPFGASVPVESIVERASALSPLANQDGLGEGAFLQMVERAIGRNPVAIVIPGHRVDVSATNAPAHVCELRAFESASPHAGA